MKTSTAAREIARGLFRGTYTRKSKPIVAWPEWEITFVAGNLCGAENYARWQGQYDDARYFSRLSRRIDWARAKSAAKMKEAA